MKYRRQQISLSSNKKFSTFTMDITDMINREGPGGDEAKGGPLPSSRISSNSNSPSSHPAPITRRCSSISDIMNHQEDDDTKIPSKPPPPPSSKSVDKDTNTEKPTIKMKKPRKYENPPIWAQKWTGKPTWKATSWTNLDDSINHIVPYEELTREVSNRIFTVLQQHQDIINQIEIEAKVGNIIELSTNERLQLPIMTESVLNSESLKGYMRFESQVDPQSYTNYYHLLKGKEVSDPEIRSSESHEIDEFYPSPSLPNERLRVTRNMKSRSIKCAITKVRLADIYIFCPSNMFDVRISISHERPEVVDQSFFKGNQRVYERHKHRYSFTHQICQFDLTQVENNGQIVSGEVEIELDNSALSAEYSKISQNKGNGGNYEHIIKIFLDNTRILARAPTGG